VQSSQDVTWQNNTGVTTQAAAGFANTWFVNGGVRVEHDSRLPAGQIVALPMVGAAAVRDVDGFTFKLRGAYGAGIRPPGAERSGLVGQYASSVVQQPLGAERQAGTEVGLDAAFRHAVSLRVTRFDQQASGLIQQVAVSDNTDPMSRRIQYALENVGEITNRGWEMEGAANLARLTVAGTLSLVDSRVEKLARGYTGDLMTGDRMLQVPARTAALRVSYTGREWAATVGGSRAFNWIGYDQLGISRAYLDDTHVARELVGAQLRGYWRPYNGGLRLRASVSRDFRDLLTFEVTGDNLLNYQRNEPDNLTIVPGRALMTGVRVRF
jgi:iron complex outermembrane receptor protein